MNQKEETIPDKGSSEMLYVCCTFSHIGVGPALSGPSPVQVVYQPPPWVQMTTPAPLGEVEKGPVEWSLPQQVNLGNSCR